MKFKKLIICLFVLQGFFVYGARAQEAISATGGDFTGSGGSIAFSAGQLVFITYKSGTGIVSEGVQQSWWITDVTQNSDKFKTKVNCNVYPNPVANILKLKLGSKTLSESSKFEYRLFDIKGNLLLMSEITGSEAIVNMKELVSATYFLHVDSKSNRGSNSRSVFKIIKQ